MYASHIIVTLTKSAFKKGSLANILELWYIMLMVSDVLSGLSSY